VVVPQGQESQPPGQLPPQVLEVRLLLTMVLAMVKDKVTKATTATNRRVRFILEDKICGYSN
jgi:hypothetical protein